MDTKYLTQQQPVVERADDVRLSPIGAAPTEQKLHERPQTPTASKIAFVLGCLTTSLGVAVMFGWHIHSVFLTSIRPHSTTMAYATALGFVAAGASIAVQTGFLRRLPNLVRIVTLAIGSGYSLVIGSIAIIEYIAGRGLSVDRLLFWGYASGRETMLSRPAPNTAFCILLAGVAIVLSALRSHNRFRYAIVATLASIIASIGFVAASGYALDIMAFYSWSSIVRMALPTSIGLMLEGAGLLALAWGQEERVIAGAPSWLPIPAGGAVATVMLSLFQMLIVHMSLESVLLRPNEHTPHWEAYNRTQAFIPVAELVVGISASLLFAAVVRLTQRAYMQSTKLGIANARLTDEIAERKRLETSLAETNAQLDNRVRERTRELEEAQDRLRQTNEELDQRVQERTAALWREQQFTKAVLDNVHAGVVACDLNGVLTFFNPVAREYHLRAEKPIPPEMWSDYYGIYQPDGQTKLRMEQIPLYRALRGELVSNVEVVIMAKDEPPRLVEVNGQPMKDENGRQIGAVVVMHDITQRKQIEEALRESEARFKNAFENAPIGMALCDLDGTFRRVNRSLCEIVGYTEEEMLAINFRQITHPEDLEADLAQVQRLLSGEIHYYEMEKRYFHKDGHIVWILLSGSLLRGDDNQPLYFIAQILDISGRKEAEAKLRRQAEELQRSNTELEQFAYIASHDLQEPLRKVQTFSRMLESKYAGALGDQGKDYIARMQSATSRMQRLIADLLTLSRVTMQAQPFEAVDLSSTVRDVIADVDATIARTGATIDVGPLPTISASQAQMRQLFQNLISNALKYQTAGNKPMIRITTPEAEPGMCRIDVADNGIGFEPEYVDRIFAPFQRLHARDEYEGTGIGLAICRKIVERHHGTIAACSSPGAGATFTITLPKMQRNKEVNPDYEGA